MGHHDGCGGCLSILCCPCRCIAQGICSCIMCILISALVVVGVVVLILYLVFKPQTFTAHVDNASLTQFSLSSSNTLQYNLALNMTIRNPNQRVGLYYDNVQSSAWYDGNRFGYEQINSFFQNTNTNTEIDPAFSGSQLLLGDTVSGTYKSEAAAGYYTVDVKVNATIRFKIWGVFKIPGPKSTIDCLLELPAPGNTTSSFQGKGCTVSF